MKNLSPEEIELTLIDPILGALIDKNGHIEHVAERDYFEALSGSIISQQISVKAAATIFSRFKHETQLRPERAAELGDDQVKTIGLSSQKSRYIRDLAQHFVARPDVFDHLETLTDDEVINELTAVHGIGVWTAQMFLMFTLQRPDIFAPNDLGLQTAVQRLYNLSSRPTPRELEEFACKWQPYRTIAAYHLWHFLDNAPRQEGNNGV